MKYTDHRDLAEKIGDALGLAAAYVAMAAVVGAFGVGFPVLVWYLVNHQSINH